MEQYWREPARFDFEARHRGEPLMQTLPLPKPADDMPVVLVRR